LLVSDKDRYTVSFLVICPCIYVLHPQMVYLLYLQSSLVPFLWWFQLVQDFYIHSCIESLSPIFKFLSFLLLPYLSCVCLPLNAKEFWIHIITLFYSDW
jgi:hypothetical protein